jgi:hypothetical protein
MDSNLPKGGQLLLELGNFGATCGAFAVSSVTTDLKKPTALFAGAWVKADKNVAVAKDLAKNTVYLLSLTCTSYQVAGISGPVKLSSRFGDKTDGPRVDTNDMYDVIATLPEAKALSLAVAKSALPAGNADKNLVGATIKWDFTWTFGSVT